MHPVQSLILSYLLNSLWQAPLLFAASWLIARTLRSAGPAAEHRVWVVVLVLQSLLPALCLIPRQWFTALLYWSTATHVAGHARAVIITGPGIAVNPNILPAWLPAFATLAYLAVCAYLVVRFLWRWTKFRALRTEAVEVALPAPAADCWRLFSERFGITGASLAASSRIAGPVTLGFSRRLILLPAATLSHFLQDDFPALIAHEFAHIRRNDFLKNLLYELFALPVSYHPLLWLTREKVIETRELVCDQIAAEASGQRQYTQSLLRLANLLIVGRPARIANAIGIFDAGKFERRLMNLTEKKHRLTGVRRLAVITFCAVFAFATCASGMALAVHVNTPSQNADSKTSNPSAPVTISAHVMAGNRIGGPQIKYPVEAKKKRIQGLVVLHALIGKDGTIKDLKAVSGPTILEQSALTAVRQWKYKPYLLKGQPVQVETVINVIYSLDK
ncbi:MAG TPA: M56 family metallopeptidase [Acidobacteriaceae bacterium]|nr:M56 family metallopeptidase [Acidobacteriaceae bacterium]